MTDTPTLHDKVSAIFRKVFDAQSLTLRDETTAADIDGWDSLAQINLVVAAEEAFALRFTTAEIRGLRNVGDFKALIGAKLQVQGR